MEIFNIHLFEFLLIAGLALIVFGPERLPEAGRFAGKQVARFLAWQQQSPELKLINDVRSEFEQEIASLRDELVRTRKQLDLSQDGTLTGLRDELRPMLSLRDELKGAGTPATPDPAPAPTHPKTWDPPPGEEGAAIERPSPEVADALDQLDAPAPPAEPGPGAPVASDPPASPAAPPVGEADAQPLPAPRAAPEGTVQAATRPNRLAATEPTTVFERAQPDGRLSQLEGRRRSLHDQPATDDPPAALNGQGPHAPAPAPPIAAEEVRLLAQQLERVSADLQALISGLQARGVIGADWEPDAAVAEQESMSR